MHTGLFWVLCGALVFVAWGVACHLEPQEAPSHESIWERMASTFSDETPSSEIRASVDATLGVNLTAEDVQAWKRLVSSGESGSEALRIVATYRRAQGGRK